jgi:hypothetical protein
MEGGNDDMHRPSRSPTIISKLWHYFPFVSSQFRNHGKLKL